MDSNSAEERGLQSRNWQYSYRTSSATPGKPPADMLHDFYIPVLRRSVRYDRVAGYFRSSSLAAASQGFSAFVGRQGRMRLIVGVDMEPGDAEAILAGEEERLSRQLSQELEEREEWPEEVRNGVELLAWMVAEGYLDVRVAIRVHGTTGEPLSFDDFSDGYAHEKWAIFYDEHGNRLYITGSLNESKRALVRNAENIDVHCDWWGERERQRLEDAVITFENIWGKNNPYFRVFSLPEAVRERLIKIGKQVKEPKEIDGSSAAPRKVEPPSALERLRFALIRDGPRLPGGRFVGMETAAVRPWPHQKVVARRLIETWPYSYLLCDEVGLGKTIEAGLAIRSLYLSGLIRRVLIVAPASLKQQWQREMASKFFLRFARTETSPFLRHHYIHPLEESKSLPSPYTPDLNIISAALLTRSDRRRQLSRAERFDLALLDEAHAARRQNPTQGRQVFPRYGNLYQTLDELLRKRARSLWLATATPMQLDPIEAWDLLRLTNRVGPFQLDPSLTAGYYQSLGKLVRDEALEREEWEFWRRAIRSLRRQDPLLWNFLNDAVIDGRMRPSAQRWLEDGQIPAGADRRHMRRLIFTAAPLSRVMLRHTRGLLEIYRQKGQLRENLAERIILPIPTITFTPEERRIYDLLEDYCRELNRQVRLHGDAASRHSVGFYLSFLRLRFASSFRAIRETVRRRVERVIYTLEHLEEQEVLDPAELESLVYDPEEEEAQEAEQAILKNRSPEDLEWEREHLAEMLTAIQELRGHSSKMLGLLNALQERRIKGTGRIQQTVIFTRFFDTLTEIVDTLRQVHPDILLGTYSGKGGQYTDPGTKRLLGIDREEVKRRFLRREVDVLLCTDAAAEGLNLQTADWIINFDLPWNPMKVEQRIGRIDRIGQKHEQVFVLNLCYVDSAEQTVYGRLLERLEKATQVVGTFQVSMLPVTAQEFMELAEGTLDPGELEVRAMERIRLERQRTASMEIPPADLHEIYLRLESGSAASGPVDLDAIWTTLSGSRYLRDLGCTVSPDVNRPSLTLFGLAEIPNKTVLTTSRDLYERGAPELPGPLHFASYGDPCFDAVLEELGQFELPACIRRLRVEVADGIEAVGYAVVCRGDTHDVRLVTAWRDLNALEVDEEAVLSDDEGAPLEARLKEQVRREFQNTLAVDHLELANVRSARAQLLLNCLVARSLITVRKAASENSENFWFLARDLEEFVIEGRTVSLTKLPADPLKLVEADFVLFEPTIPALGPEANILAPPALLQAALEEACRQADAMKVRRSELTTEMLLARLQRQIDEQIRLIKLL